MKFVTLILIYCLTHQMTDAQETVHDSWTKKLELPMAKEDIWSVDVLQNVYVTKKQLLQKFDSVGLLKFSQSIRSLGRIRQIEPINTMKVVVFSEEQQTVCTLDNTLTLGEECIDLSTFNVANASIVAVSAQPDKLWVLDQLNSTLSLLTFNKSNQFQEIKNLKGLLDVAQIKSIKEYYNQLFLGSVDGRIYQFDMYGSLMAMHEVGAFQDFSFRNNRLILLQDEWLTLYDLTSQDKKSLPLPEKNVFEINLSGIFIYFRTENKISKYMLHLHD